MKNEESSVIGTIIGILITFLVMVGILTIMKPLVGKIDEKNPPTRERVYWEERS